jgi:hypothetical protein
VAVQHHPGHFRSAKNMEHPAEIWETDIDARYEKRSVCVCAFVQCTSTSENHAKSPVLTSCMLCFITVDLETHKHQNGI